MNTFFTNATPIWLEGLEKERNITAGLYTEIDGAAGKATLSVATSGFYRVFMNGRFVTYGPARCAHGYFRVDQLELDLEPGKNHIALEVVGYYLNGFACLLQPSFIQAELVVDDVVCAATGAEGFTTYRLTERIRKMQRYSYQRPMSESYRLTAGVHSWRLGAPMETAIPWKTAQTEDKRLIDRGIAPFFFPVCDASRKVSEGTFVTGVIPENYKRDRSLREIGDPENGIIWGWHQEELELHLSDEVQQWQVTGLVEAVDADPKQTKLTEGRFTILALPCEKTGFICLDLVCTEAGTIYLAYDETLRPNGDVDPLSMECMNAIRLDVVLGTYSFQSMEPYGFQFIKLACTAGTFTVENVHVRELTCPQPITATYEGDDPELAMVFDAAVETFRQNAVDVFMDCPTRERAGWLCDSFFTARSEWALTGDNVIERAFLENYRLPERFDFLPEGMIPMCYPADTLDRQFIPNWAMWFVLQLEDHVRRNGDRAFAESFRDRVYGLVRYFAGFENEDGLLEKLESWVFLEWSRANQLVQDINFPTNMMYARMLKAVSALYDDPVPAEKAEKLIECIRRRSFNGQFFTDNEVYQDGKPVSSGESTETCQYYAFFTGVATPELYPELWQTLLKDFGPNRVEQKLWPEIWPSNAFIGNYLRLELLLQHGQYAQLIEECRGYFAYMAKRTGTLWENITDYASCNHGFASYTAVFILEAEKHCGR
jgi:alpha-L-rhamnosidase